MLKQQSSNYGELFPQDDPGAIYFVSCCMGKSGRRVNFYHNGENIMIEENNFLLLTNSKLCLQEEKRKAELQHFLLPGNNFHHKKFMSPQLYCFQCLTYLLNLKTCFTSDTTPRQQREEQKQHACATNLIYNRLQFSSSVLSLLHPNQIRRLIPRCSHVDHVEGMYVTCSICALNGG